MRMVRGSIHSVGVFRGVEDDEGENRKKKIITRGEGGQGKETGITRLLTHSEGVCTYGRRGWWEKKR